MPLFHLSIWYRVESGSVSVIQQAMNTQFLKLSCLFSPVLRSTCVGSLSDSKCFTMSASKELFV